MIKDIQETILRLKKEQDVCILAHLYQSDDILEVADYVGSTTGILHYALESEAKEFIIGTENSICAHLQLKQPEKFFYPLSKDCVCHNMKATTLGDVPHGVRGTGWEEIQLDESAAKQAVKCMDQMLALAK